LPTSLKFLYLTGRQDLIPHSGYLNDPQATKEAFHNGWLKQETSSESTPKDFFTLLSGRKKSSSMTVSPPSSRRSKFFLARNYSSLQMPPTELEALVTYPFVLEAAVCAKWEKKRGSSFEHNGEDYGLP
jgi:hypothetical protein